MSEKKTAFEEAWSSLKQQRDQLRVRINLAGMEARDEFQRLSDKMEELKHHYEPLQDAVGETADNVYSALSMVADEMKNGFSRIWNSLGEDS